MEVTKPIKIGNYWTNLVDSVTGENVNYEEVATWFDGTSMDDSKADGAVYRKLPSSAGGGYVRRVYDNFGQLFLEKSSVDEVRNLTDEEVLLLRIGRYRGIQLNGYYAEGDTPEPIQYFLYEGAVEDDGGEVLNISDDFKVRHDFGSMYTAAYFGVMGSNSAGINGPRIDVMIEASARNPARSTLIFQEGPVILTTGGHMVPRNTNVWMRTRLRENVNGAVENTLMTLGYDGNSTSCYHIINVDRSTTNPRPTWDSRDKVGVVIRNHQKSVIEVVNASLFGVGVEFLGENGGNVYNTIQLGQFLDNYINILISAIGTGWTNDNTFIGGSINNNTSWDSNLKYGVYFESESRNLHNNRFIGTSFEGKNIWAVRADTASQNKFTNVRWEISTFSVIPNADGGFAIENPTNCRDNVYEIGYQNQAIPLEIRSLTSRPVLRSSIKLIQGNTKFDAKSLVATSGNLVEHISLLSSPQSGGKTYRVNYPFFLTSASTGERVSQRFATLDSAFNIHESSVTCTGYAITSSIRVAGRRRLYISAEFESDGEPQRLGVIAYDADGARITSNNQVSISTPQSIDTINTFQSNLLGGSWFVQDVDAVVVGLGLDVEYLDVFVSGTKIKSLRVYSPEQGAASDFYSDFAPPLPLQWGAKEVTGAYSAETFDQILAVNTASASSTITLPPNSSGQRLDIVDLVGNASSNNITISGTFWDGSPSKVIDTNYGRKSFVFLRGSTTGWIELT